MSNGSILFYCKDCDKIVDTERFGKKYVYKCKKCGTKNVAFGTKKSIYSFFHVQEEPEQVPVAAIPAETAAVAIESTAEEVVQE